MNRLEQCLTSQFHLLVCIALAFDLSNVAIALHELLQPGLFRLKIGGDAPDNLLLFLTLCLERVVSDQQLLPLLDELINLGSLLYVAVWLVGCYNKHED